MDAFVKVPLFLLALLAIRGLPALAYRAAIGARRSIVAALLQATSLPFIVAGTAIGLELGLVGGGEAAALVAAGLLSLLVFPLAGLTIMRGGGAQMSATATCLSGPTVSARLPSSSSSSSLPTTSRRQPCSVRTSGGGRPSRIASTIRCRSARAAMSS